MAMNRQKTRWMLLGWLGRAAHLARLTAYTMYDKELPHHLMLLLYCTQAQRIKLISAVNLIQEVLQEISSDKGTGK